MSIVAESRKALRQAAKCILDQLVPGHCLLCGSASDGDLVCAACDDNLPRLGASACPRCAEPDMGGLICPSCQKQAPPFARAWAVWRYEYPLDRLVQALKYGAELGLTQYFGKALSKQLAPFAQEWDGIVPLPLHSRRLMERGFNQGHEVARVIAGHLQLPLLSQICHRQRPTQPQAGLHLEERRRNLRQAFHCTTDLASQRLLLVDDVMTSGATLAECARTLKLHGASAVDVAVVARTPSHLTAYP